MTFLPVPKLLKWEYSLSQKYTCPESVLVTSGCSFTSSTLQLDTATSWPGYVVDRCRFNYCIDYSFPGAGNEYIADSILDYFSTIDDNEVSRYKVIIMWSGIDRQEEKHLDGDIFYNSHNYPKINNISYHRIQSKYVDRVKSTQCSVEKIFEVYNYLNSRNISFAFTFYSNLLFPPYIPKRDTTHHFEDYVNSDTLNKLKTISWIPSNPMDYLYEYAFVNDLLNHEDYFHPLGKCNLEWTDNVLLPDLVKMGLISQLDH
jgi:hypothetical protein